MKFLDLHAHPIFKTLFNDLSPWEFLKVNDSLIGDILQSQSNLQQIIHNGDCNLVCITLHPPETAFLDQWLLKLLPILTPDYEKEIVDRMVSGDPGYHEVLQEEVKNLHRQPNDGPRKQLVVLRNFSDYDPTDLSRLYIFFNIEGGHSFYNLRNATDNVPAMLNAFRNFVGRTDLLFLYITPVHLAPSIFMTHAYGSKLLAKGKLLPKGEGIFSNGKMLLNEIFKTSLLIDVKHMSLVARQHFYANADWKGRPIISSHSGITGISWSDKLNPAVVDPLIKPGNRFVKITYRKPVGWLAGTRFNPCSINLYDEDIIKILASGGIIGLSFDLRIMGGDTDLLGRLKPNEKEFLSPEEFRIWEGEHHDKHADLRLNFDHPYKESRIEGDVDDDVWDAEDVSDELEELVTVSRTDLSALYSKLSPQSEQNAVSKIYNITGDRKEEHTRFLINQIIHIVNTAQKAGLTVDPWKLICLGTDFDGFIKAIDSCKNISLIDDLGNLMISLLPGIESEPGITLPRSPSELVHDFLFDNAFRFIQGHFKRTT